MTAPALGIDIGGTAVKTALRRGKTWHLGTSDRYQRPDRAELLAALRQALSQCGAQPGQPVRAGLCCPGIPSADGSGIEISVNVPGLVGWCFEAMLAEALAVTPVAITRVSDAEAAVSDWWQAHRPPGRVLGLVMGTGVGLSVLDEGRPLVVCDGGSGHIGQIDVTVGPAAEAPIGPDGGRGGLEGYVGAEAVRRAGGIQAAFAPASPGLLALARGVRIAHAIYRPHVIVLLGGIGRRLEHHRPLIEAIGHDLTSLARPGWRLAFGTDDHHAARGAASAVELPHSV